MSRLSPYLGIVAALTLGALLAVFSDSDIVRRVSAPSVQTASSTVFVVPTVTLPIITIPELSQNEASTTTSGQEKKELPSLAPEKVAPKTPKSAPATTSAPTITPVSIELPTPPSGSAALDASATVLRAALVNIICYAPAGSRLRSISGSGVIVDSKGIILTNAHIAQNFLLADRGVSCTIRVGSPAIDKYKASLIYIPSAWISANADILTKVSPSGTGEYDFAFLAIDKSTNKDKLPPIFPSISLATSPSNTGTPVVIASYGAQFIDSSQIQSSLFPTIVFGSVKNVYTFVQNTIDVIALGGSAAAQEGSSGGGVADASGSLVGTITTSTTKGTTDTRNLDAITASYIRAAYASETGSALDILLATSTDIAISDFAPKMPALGSILTAGL